VGIFIQLLINGLIAGAIYALVSSGFSLIYSTCKFVHFAHGSAIAFSAYMLFLLFSTFGINFWIGVILAICLTSLFGIAINSIVYKSLRKRKASGVILLIASFALLILV